MMPAARTALIAGAVLAAVLAPAAMVALRAERGSASFGDSERISANHVSSAVVSVAVGERTVPLVGPNLAPGDLVIGRIEIVNDGTVALHYALVASPATNDLAPWLDWRFGWSVDGRSCPPSGPSGPGTIRRTGAELADGAVVFGDPSTGAQPGDRRLATGSRDLLCVAASLSVDAPNDVQTTRFDQGFRVLGEQAVEVDGGGGG